MSAAPAVATLSATSRQSTLGAALAEVGRIERGIFTLRGAAYRIPPRHRASKFS